LVIASPVYWFTVSAQTKLFMDRCYALIDADGWIFRGKKIGIVMSFGDSDPFDSGAVNAFRTFQDGFNYVGAEIVGFVYGSASDPGEIRDNQQVMTKAYKLGRKLATGD
jgi:multimeric flavodoxin WrbA